MRGYLATLLFCAAIFSGSVFASSDAYLPMTFIEPSGEEVMMPSSLDEQPDTIRYDNNANASYQPQLNYWISTRFTAPANFTLHEVYVFLVDGNLSAATCDIYVYGPNGPVAGEALATAVVASPLPNFAWVQGDLSQTVNLPGGDDFYIVVGPVPGGNQGTTGYKPILDNGSTTSRSQICFTGGQFGTYQVVNSQTNWKLRAGGVIETFADITAAHCYNENVAGDAAFNVEVGEQIVLHSRISNSGTADLDEYTVTYSVEGPGGTEIFNEVVDGTDLAAGTTTTVNATGNFICGDEGEYYVTCTANTDGDALEENNSTYLRFFAGGNHRWFLYDDNDDANSYSGFSAGNGWGLSFVPMTYPAKVTAIRIDVGGAGTGDFRIYMNGEEGIPVGEPAWSATPAVVAGWNEIDVDPPVQIFEGGSFTVASLFQEGVTMGNDSDPPNCAGIEGMPQIAWQASSDGGEWFEDTGGNLCIQAYIDTSSAVPPWAVIELSSTALAFGDVPTNAPASQELWVYNRGDVDNLSITSIAIVPPAAAAVYTFDPSTFTVAAGDSELVTVTFAPTTVGQNYNGLATINNSSQNDPAIRVTVSGTGDDPESSDDVIGGLPTEFSLSQNYPNPFNPSTEIQYALPMDAHVNLTVINLLGQEVSTIASGFRPAGMHTVSFNAVNLPAGLYFYRLEAADFTAIRKMMLLK